jgi:hypothetical protein
MVSTMSKTSGESLDWAPWVAAVSAVLAFDATLIARGQDSLSARAGRHPATTLSLLTYLACHFVGWPRWLARFDPLHLLAGLIPKGGGPALHALGLDKSGPSPRRVGAIASRAAA